MKKRKAKKKITVKAKTKSKARAKPATKSKAKPKAKPKPKKARARPKKVRAGIDLITINQGQQDIFDEVEELRRIETCLDVIFGHLRRIKNEGGESSLQLILDYFYSKYGVRFFSRQ